MGNNQPWFKHYPPEIPKSIVYDQKSLHEYSLDTGNKYKEKKALHFMGKNITYGQLLSEVKKMAAFFQESGLKKGDRVAVMLPNCPQGVISYYGALLAGGTVVQVNSLYTERELNYQLKDSGASFIICLDILLPRVSAIREKTDLQHVVVTREADYLQFT